VAALQLSQTDRSWPEKLIGMLGSAFEGERLNTLAMLQKMADKHKVPIHELLLGAESDTAGSVFDRQRAEQAEHRAREARFFLTSWETNFVSDLIARGTRRPSPKQALIILRILNKAKAFSAASADSEWEDAP
jgi:hypothetical protein